MTRLAAILLALALAAPPRLAVAVSARGVVSWPAPPGQAHAVVVVERGDTRALLPDPGAAGQAVAQLAPGERVSVTSWAADGRLLGVGSARAPWAVWVPVAQRSPAG